MPHWIYWLSSTQRRYDTRLSSRGCYFLIEGKKDKEMHSNDDIQLVASERHKERSLEHKIICCWLVARVLQVEIRFVVTTKAQMLAVILS